MWFPFTGNTSPRVLGQLPKKARCKNHGVRPLLALASAWFSSAATSQLERQGRSSPVPGRWPWAPRSTQGSSTVVSLPHPLKSAEKPQARHRQSPWQDEGGEGDKVRGNFPQPELGAEPDTCSGLSTSTPQGWGGPRAVLPSSGCSQPTDVE